MPLTLPLTGGWLEAIEMTTKPSILLKDDSKCRNVSSTEGLDILCTAIELESESSIKTTTYCTVQYYTY